MRSFWLNLQDAVEGTPLLVAPAKGGAKGECLRCYYIRRGSFKDLDAAELRTLIFKNPALKTKFRSLRRRHIKLTTRNPGSRPRHESVDVKHYTERKDESYCDIYQEGEWMALTDYINTKITDEQIRKKLKTVAQKKAYVSNEEEDVALNGQPETVEEDAPAGAEESDAASSDEMFGFTTSAAKAKPAKPAPKRARREESAATPVQTKQNKAGPSDEQLAARLEKATAGIELLKKITALSLWQGSVKEKDVSSKLGKLCELQTQLEKDPGEVAQRLAQELQGLINQTNTCLLAIENAHDMVEKAGLSNPQFAFDNDEFKIYEDFFDAMQIDCRTAILTEIGRKLTEAGIWPNGDSDVHGNVHMVMKMLPDLQRFLALGYVLIQSKGELVLGPERIKEIKATVSNSPQISPRCALLFRANNRLKTGVKRLCVWQRVWLISTFWNVMHASRNATRHDLFSHYRTLWATACEIAKMAIDESKAASEAERLATSLTELVKKLGQPPALASSATFNEVKEAGFNCSSAKDYLVACQELKADEAAKSADQLKSALEEMTTSMNSEFFSDVEVTFSKHVQDLWLEEPKAYLYLPCRDKDEVMLAIWKDVDQNLALSEFASMLLHYAVEEKPTLKDSCAARAGLQNTLALCHKLEGLPKWVKEGRLALDRFDQQLTNVGKHEWKQLLATDGPVKALQVIQDQKLELSPELDKLVGVLKQAHVLQGLVSSPTDPLTQQAKALLTIDSLEIENIKFFFPDLMDTLSSFRSQAHENLSAGLSKIEDMLKTGKGKVSKY
ncbi:unnamed protein product, partial [Durusdinium trenchii]